MNHLPENIRLIRLSSKMTQAKFAEIVGANKDKIYTYEKGIAEPNEYLVGKIADYAGITIEQLYKKKLKEDDLNYTAVNYSTRPPKGTKEEAQKNQNDSEAILVYKEMVKQLQEQVKQQKELIDKLLQKTWSLTYWAWSGQIYEHNINYKTKKAARNGLAALILDRIIY